MEKKKNKRICCVKLLYMCRNVNVLSSCPLSFSSAYLLCLQAQHTQNRYFHNFSMRLKILFLHFIFSCCYFKGTHHTCIWYLSRKICMYVETMLLFFELSCLLHLMMMILMMMVLICVHIVRINNNNKQNMSLGSFLLFLKRIRIFFMYIYC